MADINSVFLDLDGTLNESAPGITASIALAMEEMGRPLPPDTDLDAFVGPALWRTFETLGLPKDQLDDAVASYRRHYLESGMYIARPYDGVMEMLEALRPRRMFLATAKALTYARQITAHFGFSPFLEAEFGSELDGTRSDKESLLAHALARTGADPSGAVMIGDRRYDIEGAQANGMRTIGALWGYGSEAELRSAGADHIATTPGDVIRILT